MGELEDDMPVRQLPSLQSWTFVEMRRPIGRPQSGCRSQKFASEATESQWDRCRRPPPMYLAAEGGHLEVVRLLLEGGADHSAAIQSGATALIAAAMTGNSEVVRLLLEAGADQNAASQGGVTALIVAAQSGRL